MIQKISALAAALIVISTAFPVFAQAVPEMPEPVKALSKDGAQIRYLGNDLGLDGWLVVLRGNQQFFYATPDRKALLSGVLYNGNDGKLVTTRQLQKLQSTDRDLIEQFVGDLDDAPDQAVRAEKPTASDYANLSPSEQLFLTIENSNWVALGDDNAPAVYSFIDPQCPHCHSFINDLRRGFLKRGMLQLRIIPVGLMNQESLKQAAFLLNAADAEERFYRHLDGDEEALPISNTFNTEGVELNIDVMRGWGLDVTPFSIYRDASNEVKILKGVPERLETLVSDLP